MPRKISRREFVRTSTAAGVAVGASTTAFGKAPAIQTNTIKPVVVASNNGNVYKNGGAEVGVQKAFNLITKGADVLDALIAGVNICELDPADTSVGYGGLPNADGIVQLDSCCMHGPTKRAGGVAALEGVRTPSLVAKAVLEHDRPSPAGRQGRAGLRAQHGVQDRRRSQHREIARAVARMEAAHRSGALPRSEEARRGHADGGPQHGPRRLDRSRSLLRHHQLRRRQQQRRGLRRHHDERPGVEDSRAASAIRRFSARDSTSMAMSARPVRPDAARPISTTCARS